jgi:hypothetical protein
MPTSKYAELVLDAERRRQRTVTAMLKGSLRESFSFEDYRALVHTHGPWVRPLKEANDHITVPIEEVEKAKKAYEDVASYLMQKLGWPREAVRVLPQGSASTQTLIRSPDNSKFDIDAVCAVDLARIGYIGPMEFFEKIGASLERFEPTAKKRCWNIPFSGEPFYLEFTPSVPMDQVPAQVREAITASFIPTRDYSDTALAVVDCPSRNWKPSNPEGIAKWVNDAACLRLVREVLVASFADAKAASIAPVPEQDVDIADTLRVAIRLFKRHRDMCVRRNKIEKDYQPISIIIVTLLTSCYMGLAHNERSFDHALRVLMELAELLPGMVVEKNGRYYVDNPTVEGENFAERWNGDGGERYNAFILWCEMLQADLRVILAANDPQDIRDTVRRVFGCSPDRSGGGGGAGGGGGSKVSGSAPVVPPVPATQGLA